MILFFALAGCGPTVDTAPVDDTGAPPSEYIAYPAEFAGFLSWTRYDLGADASDGLADTADRSVYLNSIPPSGSTEFPVRTLLVKVVGDGSDPLGPTLAMAKRGDTYNADGATGWEWLELGAGADGTLDGSPEIVWRGTGAPPGTPYAARHDACNNCHEGYYENDAVPSTELSLSGF